MAVGTYWSVDESSYLPLTSDKVVIFKTSNGGESWNTSFLTFGYKPQPTSITAVDENHAWLAGVDFNTNNFIMYTENGGNNWSRLFADGFRYPTSYINAIYFWDKDNGVAIGDPTWTGVDTFRYYEVQITSNGGKTWDRISRTWIPKPGPNEYGLPAAYCVRGDDVWFGTYDYQQKKEYRIFHSKDRGKHWTASVTGAALMSFADAMNGVAYNKDKLLLSADGGNTWKEIVKPFPGKISSATLTTGFTLIVTMRVQNISGPFRTYVSNDLGQTWKLYDEGNNVGIVKFADDGKGYGGEWQPVDHATRMYVYQKTNEIKTNFSNSERQVTIFPNPAKSKIHWECEQAQHLKSLKVFDVKGNELIKKTLELNETSGELDLANFPTGLYILNLTSENSQYSASFQIQ